MIVLTTLDGFTILLDSGEKIFWEKRPIKWPNGDISLELLIKKDIQRWLSDREIPFRYVAGPARLQCELRFEEQTELILFKLMWA